MSTSLILVISLLIAQGLLATKSAWSSTRVKPGAVDKKMSQFILLMDISTIAFALSMGINTGWPLLPIGSDQCHNQDYDPVLIQVGKSQPSGTTKAATFKRG